MVLTGLLLAGCATAGGGDGTARRSDAVEVSEQACGGLQGLACDPDDYCDFPDDALCGAADQTGLCRPIPLVCTRDCPGVCGCDDRFYCNACVAAQAGVDTSPSTSCSREGARCGGVRGEACGPGQYCDFPDYASCGALGGSGVCEPSPEVCTLDCPGVCGCDGQFYCNACIAARQGVDVDPNITCSP